VPLSKMVEWVARAKPSFRDATSGGTGAVALLNCTVRLVEWDRWSALPYAAAGDQGPSAAFVLYYRLHRTAQADAELRSLHSRLAELSLRNAAVGFPQPAQRMPDPGSGTGG